jgi:hypothetical protein
MRLIPRAPRHLQGQGKRMRKIVIATMMAGASTLIWASFSGCSSNDTVGVGGNTGSPGGNAGQVVFKLDGSIPGGGGGAGGSGTGPLPTGDANCGIETSGTSREPADVLLVLDRSGSMNQSISGECYCDASLAGRQGTVCPDTANCSARWTSLTSAVSATLDATPGINWGLKLFSSGGSNACSVSTTVEVAISSSSAGAIQTQISGTTPSGNTPTATAVTNATAYLKTVKDQSNKVILLATDGEPNCGAGARNNSDPDVQGTIDAITAAKNAGFSVYVVGIGPSVGNLDNFAEAGGTSKYFPATSPQDLAQALSDISKAVATCNFTLSKTPPDPSNVAVYLDKNLVPKDAANGWSFGANSQSVVLNGSTCDKVMSSASSTVQVLFGCPGSLPPPNIP